MPWVSTLTISGKSSLAPVFCACVDSGNASFSAGCCRKVVVTIRKISSTISTSISATMMIVGVERRLRMEKRMVYFFSSRYCRRMNSSHNVSISTASISTFLV